MADDKNGRDKQAQDADRRQRERALAVALERGDETEPPIDDAELDDVERELEVVEFPATGTEIVERVGDRTIDSVHGTYAIGELVPETDEVAFDSPDTVRVRLQRPTIAASMKRIVEASQPLQDEDLGRSQREAYEKTLRELKAIDADDGDEGVRVITDWIVERIRDERSLPGSRDVRREAAAFCRSNGYEIRNDEWLGI